MSEKICSKKIALQANPAFLFYTAPTLRCLIDKQEGQAWNISFFLLHMVGGGFNTS